MCMPAYKTVLWTYYLLVDFVYIEKIFDKEGYLEAKYGTKNAEAEVAKQGYIPEG